jgi:hypothetical protein
MSVEKKYSTTKIYGSPSMDRNRESPPNFSAMTYYNQIGLQNNLPSLKKNAFKSDLD